MFRPQRNSILSPGRATYGGTRRNQVTFYNDGSEDSAGTAGAFADLERALTAAEEIIAITGWAFHPGFFLTRGPGARPIGTLLLEQARRRPDLVIALMPWYHKVVPGKGVLTGDRESNEGGKALRRLWRELVAEHDLPSGQRQFPRNVLWRASPYDRTNAYSHHQKFVVCDAPVDGSRPDGPRLLKAFFGGLDIARGRFDWPGHPFLPGDPEVAEFHAMHDDWYSPEFGNDPECVRQPWHDIHAQLVGPTAWDFLHEFVARWCCDQYYYSLRMGPLGDDSPEGHAMVFDKYLQLGTGTTAGGRRIVRRDDPQPGLRTAAGEPAPRLWKAQLLHSIAPVAWGPPTSEALALCRNKPSAALLRSFQWPLKQPYERSIQDAYLEMIPAARDFIYIESQYLISGGKKWAADHRQEGVANEIAEALVERISRAAEGPSGPEEFHVYVLLPMFMEGGTDSLIGRAVRHLGWLTIDYMVTELRKSLGDRWRDYLSFYCLGNWRGGGPDGNWNGTRVQRVLAAQRYMIYVHSKLMIVDDRYAILGSANLNERSLNGNRDSETCVALWPDHAKTRAAGGQLAAFRRRLWEEHLGTAWMREHGHLPPGSRETVRLVREAAEANLWRFLTRTAPAAGDGHLLEWPGFFTDTIPDMPLGGIDDPWSWRARQTMPFRGTSVSQ